jgi:hypothetical protein
MQLGEAPRDGLNDQPTEQQNWDDCHGNQIVDQG